MCYRSAIHSVQPIELNFTESPVDGSAGNTIQISMDCFTMHGQDDTQSVSMWDFFSHRYCMHIGSEMQDRLTVFLDGLSDVNY